MKTDIMKQLLQRLTETFSTSGNEDAIRSVILKEVKQAADDCRVDTLGNLIVRKGRLSNDGRRNGARRIMIAAHMDEIGLMVTHVDEKGFVRFTGIGGIYPRNLPGGRVRFVNGTSGVIGRKATIASSSGFMMTVSFHPISWPKGGLTMPSQPTRLMSCILNRWK